MTLQEKRKKIETMVVTTMNKMDKTCSNGNKYKEFFKSMTDEQFSKWAKNFLNDDEQNFYMEFLPYKNEPVLQDLIDAGEYLKCPLDEYIYYRNDGNKDNPVRSKYKVPVGYIVIRKLQQMLMKKNSYSLSNTSRNLFTNQLTGDDKVARMTEAENYAGTLLGIEDGFKELLGPRADDSVAKTQLYQQIASQGYCTLADIDDDLANKYTLNTVDVFMIGAGLMSDLVTDTLELRRTQDERNRRKGSSERITDKAEQ